MLITNEMFKSFWLSKNSNFFQYLEIATLLWASGLFILHFPIWSIYQISH